MTTTPTFLLVMALALSLPANAAAEAAAKAPTGATPTAAEAKAFVAKVNEELKKLYAEAARADWVKNTYITDDTETISAQAAEKLMLFQAQAIKDAARFDGVIGLDADTARALLLLKLSPDLPAPNDPKKTTELSEIASKLTSMYGKGKYCRKGEKPEQCRDLEQLTEVMTKSRNYDELLDAWQGWHTISPPMKPMYQRYVELSNEGARDLGFKDVAALWRGRYDMAPEAFEADMDRVWGQLKPLYQDLHCYARTKLAAAYPGKVKSEGPIPAHLLGNMWAQEWANIYPLVEPYAGEASLDVTKALQGKKKTEVGLVNIGEGFFTSIGLKALPKSFYEKSLFLKPTDREVVCHASAWDLAYDAKANDVRIKMCIKVDEDNLVTIHHELGHIYYYEYYNNKPVLFQQGANDGFHEAIGDAIALSVNPKYLTTIGVFDKAPADNEKNLINLQMKDALDKIAFLPFGLLMDKWRWDVFSGKTKPAEYNKRWWELRTQYQGIAPVATRGEASFDPGAKYHIPANVPYARYFLARILQFQMHKALCDAAGHKGPLHTCSIYGNKKAGAKLQKLLELGASRPWPDALEAVTGTRQLDAQPMLDYFAPLSGWLKEQNKASKCGW
ncbi:MAG: M2 family metallopeptidase [Deltaproteobacteria bacterium]|nr:M2 family metallopeptidase [Deltaproteobacteria bacterium]